MKSILTAASLFFLLLLSAEGDAQSTQQPPASQEPPVSKPEDKPHIVGFVDKNNDGVNDRFYDADGDGRNDVDAKAYPHNFQFVDENKDKINDLWIDRDGDGVNDLAAKLKPKDRGDRNKIVLDANGDGHNDITGDAIDKTKHGLNGRQWGFWEEQAGRLHGRFIDEDGDGIDDRIHDFEAFMGRQQGQHNTHDLFIDEDGDGICDGRSDFISRMGRHGHGGNDKRSKGGGKHH